MRNCEAARTGKFGTANREAIGQSDVEGDNDLFHAGRKNVEAQKEAVYGVGLECPDLATSPDLPCEGQRMDPDVGANVEDEIAYLDIVEKTLDFRLSPLTVECKRASDVFIVLEIRHLADTCLRDADVPSKNAGYLRGAINLVV